MSIIKKFKIAILNEDGTEKVFNSYEEADEYLKKCAIQEKMEKAGIQDIEKFLETNRKNALLACMTISNSYQYTTEDTIQLRNAILYCLNHLYSTTALTIYQLVKELMDGVLDGDIQLDIEGLDLTTWVMAIKELSDRHAISFYIQDGVYFIGLPSHATQGLANSAPDPEKTGESISEFESTYKPDEE